MYKKIEDKRLDESQERAVSMIQEAERLEVCVCDI
jgi:hypothetical protein